MVMFMKDVGKGARNQVMELKLFLTGLFIMEILMQM